MAKQNNGRAPHKKGEWLTITKGRSLARNRVLVTNPGAFQMPRVGDVGSAAYRRLMASRKTSKRRTETPEERLLRTIFSKTN